MIQYYISYIWLSKNGLKYFTNLVYIMGISLIYIWVHISHSGAQIKCLTGQKIAAHQNNLKNEATQDLRFSKVKQGVAWGRAGYSRHQEVELEVEMETSGGEPRGKTNQNVARTRRSQLDIMDAHFQ